MRRVIQVNSVPDFSSIDEPFLAAGPAYLSLRRILYLGLAAAILGSALALGGPVIAVVPGGLQVTPGLLAGILGAGVVLAIGFQEPKALSVESMILLALHRPRPREARPGSRAEEYTIKADPDLGTASIEIVGYAIDPATGKPLDAVSIQLGGERILVDVDSRGLYATVLELPRGSHELRIFDADSGVELRRILLTIV